MAVVAALPCLATAVVACCRCGRERISESAEAVDQLRRWQSKRRRWGSASSEFDAPLPLQPLLFAGALLLLQCCFGVCDSARRTNWVKPSSSASAVDCPENDRQRPGSSAVRSALRARLSVPLFPSLSAPCSRLTSTDLHVVELEQPTINAMYVSPASSPYGGMARSPLAAYPISAAAPAAAVAPSPPIEAIRPLLPTSVRKIVLSVALAS